MKNKINEIASSFESGLEDNGFFLSNIASKSSILPKLINGLLIASTLSGAMSGVVTASEFNQEQNINEDNMYSVVRHDLSQPDKVLSDAIQNHKSSAPRLDVEALKSVSEGSSGAFSMPSGNVIFIFNKSDIQLSSPQESMELQQALFSKHEFFMNMKGSGASSPSIDVNGSQLSYGIAKIGFNDYTTHLENFKESHPTVAKHESLLIAAHEISHALLELDTVSVDGQYIGNHEKILINEAFADINSLVIVAKAENLSATEFVELAEDLEHLRVDSSNRLDSHHGSFYALEHLTSAVKADPSVLTTLKSSSLEDITKFSSDLAVSTTTDLVQNANYRLEKVFTFKDLENDAVYFAEYGKHSPNSAISNALNAGLKSKWESTVEMLAERQSELGSIEAAIKENQRDCKKTIGYGWHASGLNDSLQSYYRLDHESSSFVKDAMDKMPINQNDYQLVDLSTNGVDAQI